jgi:hypothetical protein
LSEALQAKNRVVLGCMVGLANDPPMR